MPRSTTTVEPGRGPVRFSKLSNISPTVVRSWRFPSRTSCALGKPSRSSTNPTQVVNRFVRLGLLEEVTGFQRSRRFRYAPYLALFEPFC
jgi:hypothetical protein